jgi:hypothetical protein
MFFQSMADSFWFILYSVNVGLVSDEVEVIWKEFL